jgi:hypothetical protein
LLVFGASAGQGLKIERSTEISPPPSFPSVINSDGTFHDLFAIAKRIVLAAD